MNDISTSRPLMVEIPTKSEAFLSPCGDYRYLLSRPCEVASPTKGAAAWIMLNPSTADAERNDATINRLRAFTRRWRRDGFVVVNAYALRSTDPKGLWSHPDPIGPDNDTFLTQIARHCGDVICAWGVNARPDRVSKVRGILEREGVRMWCLGVTKDGHPRHPLYVSADQELMPWPEDATT